jgi:hypothetical protein
MKTYKETKSRTVSVINTLSSLLISSIGFALIAWHYYREFPPTNWIKEDITTTLGYLAFTHVGITSITVIPNILSYLYADKNLKATGFLPFVKSSLNFRYSLAVVLDQLAQSITIGMINFGQLSMSRSYSHSTTISFVLFSAFFYQSTLYTVPKKLAYSSKAKVLSGSRNTLGSVSNIGSIGRIDSPATELNVISPAKK